MHMSGPIQFKPVFKGQLCVSIIPQYSFKSKNNNKINNCGLGFIPNTLICLGHSLGIMFKKKKNHPT